MKCLNRVVIVVFFAVASNLLYAQTENADTSVVKRRKAYIDRKELRRNSDMDVAGTEQSKDEDDRLRSVNEGTMVGIGGYRMKDTYLSTEKYGGLGLRLVNERMRLLRLADYKMSRQQIINVDISSAINGARNANFLSAFVDYALSYHYRILPDPFFKILVGGGGCGKLGMVYHTRNGNNPMTVHADLSLTLSAAAIYEFHVKKQTLALRYQIETPFAGMLFSPVYDQSYYEIFSLGNTEGVINFTSFSEKIAVRNILTLDFPLESMTFRVGYYGDYYSTKLNDIDRHIISHNVMVGFVKEFLAFGGRDMRKRNLFRSAYY